MVKKTCENCDKVFNGKKNFAKHPGEGRDIPRDYYLKDEPCEGTFNICVTCYPKVRPVTDEGLPCEEGDGIFSLAKYAGAAAGMPMYAWGVEADPESDAEADPDWDAGSCASDETEAFRSEEEEVEEVEPTSEEESEDARDLQHLHEVYVQKLIDEGLLKRVKAPKVKQPASQRRQRVARDYSKFKVGETVIQHTYKGHTAYAVYDGMSKFSYEGHSMNISGFPKSHAEKLIKKGLCEPTKSGIVSFNGWDVCSLKGGTKGVWN